MDKIIVFFKMLGDIIVFFVVKLKITTRLHPRYMLHPETCQGLL